MARHARNCALAALLASFAGATSFASRRQLLFRAAAGSALASAPAASLAAESWQQRAGLAPPDREPLQAKWLERVRILLQDEADAVQYGGKEGLAPGGPPAAVPALLLIPVVRMQKTLRSLEPALSTPSEWPRILGVVTDEPFETVALKRAFNAYSDNIYYASGSPEANAYLLGGSTPSSKQTTQYLLRNEVLAQLAELRDELKYQQGLPRERQEAEVAAEALQKCLKAFDEYIRLAPTEERSLALDAVYGDGTAKAMQAGTKE